MFSSSRLNAKEQLYFASLLLSSPLVTVKFIDHTRGRGLFACQDLSEGDIVFRDSPLISLQHTFNRANVACTRACGHCLRFLGSIEEQIEHHQATLGLSTTIPQYESAVPCSGNCGELYCSQECRDYAFAYGHKWLCVGPLEEEHPLVQFKVME